MDGFHKLGWFLLSIASVLILIVNGYALFIEPELTEMQMFWKYLPYWAVAVGLIVGGVLFLKTKNPYRRLP